MQAVEGIEQLARDGIPSAVDGLVECANHGSLAVRAISLAALGAIGGAISARADAVARLEPDQRYLAELRRVDVRDVTQITDPTAHLTRRERDEPSPPGIDERRPWPTSGSATPQAKKRDHA